MVDINTLDRSDVGLAFRKRLVDDKNERILDLPRRTIPAGKLSDRDSVLERTRGGNHIYKEIDRGILKTARDDDHDYHLQGLDEQLRKTRDDEFDFIFLEYTDTHQLTKSEANQIVGILDEASDFLATPMQSRLVSSIEEDDGIEDPNYRALYVGQEQFLQACHEFAPDKDIIGGIPPLDLDYIENLVNLYEQYDVEMFYVDFDWNLPTNRASIARLQFLSRRLANQRLHEDSLIYGLNMRYGTYSDNLGYAPADDFAIVFMGVDMVGPNHKGNSLPPDVVEDIETEATEDDSVDEFRAYVRSDHGYRSPAVTQLGRVWPSETGLDIDDVVTKSLGSKTARSRYQAIQNAEQMELDFQKLRNAIEAGQVDEFVEDEGIPADQLRPGRTVERAFEEGLQAMLGDFD